MSKKDLIKWSEKVNGQLLYIASLAYVYGKDGLYDEAVSYQASINSAAVENDSLLFSSTKLASRFLCTAACVLISDISYEMKGLRLEGKNISRHSEQLKYLMKLL